VRHQCDTGSARCSRDVLSRIELDIGFDRSRHVLDTKSEIAMPRTNDAALDAFISAKTEIDVMLERLAALSADHFECHPEDVDWGDVGTLEHYRSRLREVTDMAFREGEHASRPVTPPPSPPHRAAPQRW
jgi:hypothetical protein